MAERMTILVAEPNKKPYTMTIDGSLESMHKIVDGYIEAVYIDENIVLVCNEEGLYRDDLEWNRYMIFPYRQLRIKGNFFLCGENDNGDFVSLPEDAIRKYCSI